MLSLIVSFLFCHLWYCCSFFGVLVQYWYSWILGLRPSGCQFSNISTLSWSTFIGIKRSPFPKVVSGTADWLSYSLTWGLTLLLNRYGSPLLLPISSSLWAWLWNHLTSGAGSFQGGSRIALLHGVNCSWEIFLYSLPTQFWKGGLHSNFFMSCSGCGALWLYLYSFLIITQLGQELISLSSTSKVWSQWRMSIPVSQLKWTGFSKHKVTTLFQEIHAP